MLYYLWNEFYFVLHCLGYVYHDLYWTQTYQNLDNFGYCWCSCHLLVLYDMIYIWTLSAWFLYIILIMHLQQQECWSCNFVLKILHNHTLVNYFYGNMCTHNHISLNLWCLYCCQLSSLLFEFDHLHMDEIIFVLQLVEWIVYFRKYVCGMYEFIFAYLLSYSFLHICLYVILLYSIYHLFHFFEYFLNKFWVNDLDDLYTDISFIIV